MYIYDMDTSQDRRLKRLFPRVYLACLKNDLARRELSRMLDHMDLLHDLYNQSRPRTKRRGCRS